LEYATASGRDRTHLEIQRVALESLHLDPANARAHDETNLASIRASLQRFGQSEALVVQAKTGRVIAGNGRLVVMKQLGYEACDVVKLDISDLEATALGIALNRTAELAKWDQPVLAQLLKELRTDGGLDGVGFEESDVDALLAELEAQAKGDVQDPGPDEPPEVPVTNGGDRWILGDHRILCGDSTNAEDLGRLMGDTKAALLATDPPYLVDYQGGNHPQSWANDPKTRDKHWDDYTDPTSGLAFFQGFLETALAHCREDVPVYQWHAHKRQALVEQAWEAAGLLVHQQLIWVKARAVLTRSHFMWQHEPCFYGWPKGKMPDKARRPLPNATTVWQIDQVGQQDGIHPTQKPLKIFARAIREHTRPGEVCLEPFSGSGTQIIAAEELGRRCMAMELSPAFVDVAVHRWEKATGKQAVLEGTGQTFSEVATDRRSA